MKILLVACVIAAGAAVAASASAEGIYMNQRFSGAGHPTMVDTNDDGVFANVINYEMWGSPGRSTLNAFGEFEAPDVTTIPGCQLRFALVQQSYIATYNDGSMLFGEATEGHNCLDTVTWEFTSEVGGEFTGGTGRFEGATGWWSVESIVLFVGEQQFAVTGRAWGQVQTPD